MDCYRRHTFSEKAKQARMLADACLRVFEWAWPGQVEHPRRIRTMLSGLLSAMRNECTGLLAVPTAAPAAAPAAGILADAPAASPAAGILATAPTVGMQVLMECLDKIVCGRRELAKLLDKPPGLCPLRSCEALLDRLLASLRGELEAAELCVVGGSGRPNPPLGLLPAELLIKLLGAHVGFAESERVSFADSMHMTCRSLRVALDATAKVYTILPEDDDNDDRLPHDVLIGFPMLSALKICDPGWADRSMRAVAARGAPLRYLQLHIGGVNGFDLAPPLSQLAGLQRLEIRGDGVRSRDFRESDSVLELMQAIGALSALERLAVSGLPSLSSKGCCALVSAMRGLVHLKEIRLHNVDMSSSSVRKLAEALGAGKGACLLSLDLGGNKRALPAGGAAALAPALIRAAATLASLNLRGCGLEPEGAEALAPALAQLTALTFLGLGGNPLGPRGAVLLAPALGEMRSMRVLRLGRCGAEPEGVAALAPALANMTALELLDLRKCGIGPSLAVLGPTLQALSGSLRSINLADNFVGGSIAHLLMRPAAAAAPVVAAAAALAAEAAGVAAGLAADGVPVPFGLLTSLRIQGNALGGKGITALFRALPCMPNLTHLDVSCESRHDGNEMLVGSLISAAFTALKDLRTLRVPSSASEDSMRGLWGSRLCFGREPKASEEPEDPPSLE